MFFIVISFVCVSFVCVSFSTSCFSINGSDDSEMPPIPNTITAIQIPEIIAPIVKEGRCNVCF